MLGRRGPKPPESVRRIWRRLKSEELGISLTMTLALMTILTVSTAAIANELVFNQSDSARNQTMVSALSAAEAQMAFAAQWVQKNDPLYEMADGSAYPTTDVDSASRAQLGADDDPVNSTWYYTADAVSGADAGTYGWWAQKYIGYAGCHLLLPDNEMAPYDTTTPCWLVDGRAAIGLSTREVQAVLTLDSVETAVVNVTNTYTNTNTNTEPVTAVTTAPITITSSTPDNSLWGYGAFSNNPIGSCMTISGSANIQESVYTRGNLCLTGSSQITQPAGKTVNITVKGTLRQENSTTVGKSNQKVTNASINACQVKSGNSYLVVPCSTMASSHVYSTNYNGTPATITKPTVDLNAWYANASPGPNHPCDVALGSYGSAPAFDSATAPSSTTRDNSLGDIVNASIWTASAYDCKTSSGELKWDPSTSVMTISGVIFFDGNLKLAGNQVVKYSGTGSLYFNGTLNDGGGTNICPVPEPGHTSCEATSAAWNMSHNLLTLVFGFNNVVPDTSAGCTSSNTSVDIQGNAVLQVIAFANGCISLGGTGGIEGPMAGDGIAITGSVAYYQSIEGAPLPSGTPTNYVYSTTSTNTIATTTYTLTIPTTTTYTQTTSTAPIVWGQDATSWRQIK